MFARNDIDVDMLEQSFRELFNDPVQGWTDALGLLADKLGARGAEVGAVTELGAPYVLISYGEIEKITTNRKVWDFFCRCWGSKDLDGQCTTAVFDTPDKVACIAFNRSQANILCVILWGRADTKFNDLALACAFLRIFEYFVYHEHQTDDKYLPSETQRVKRFPTGYLEGRSAAITQLYRELDSLSQGDFPVLILGETGVGKEYIAQLLHLWSGRACGPFVPVNCAAIPNELWEAEMFGIAKGVATGVHEREGYFSKADGGTLFLDEVGEIPQALQSKLLRVLQDSIVTRLGGTQVKVNVRVIAATNTDIWRLVGEGKFRPDLYYRIASVTLHVPSLRERPEDFPIMLQNFLRKFSREAGRPVPGVTIDAFEALREYHWPGNIREMENELRRLVYTCRDTNLIDESLLSTRILSSLIVNSEQSSIRSLNLELRLNELERQLIIEALTKARGNRSLAAKTLGVTRTGLAMKMERLGIKD